MTDHEESRHSADQPSEPRQVCEHCGISIVQVQLHDGRVWAHLQHDPRAIGLYRHCQLAVATPRGEDLPAFAVNENGTPIAHIGTSRIVDGKPVGIEWPGTLGNAVRIVPGARFVAVHYADGSDVGSYTRVIVTVETHR